MKVSPACIRDQTGWSGPCECEPCEAWRAALAWRLPLEYVRPVEWAAVHRGHVLRLRLRVRWLRALSAARGARWIASVDGRDSPAWIDPARAVRWAATRAGLDP